MIVIYDVADVTCRKAGCGNSNVTLSVYRRSGGDVICGVCESYITDIVKTGEVSLDE